jgi:hypothetical protein
LSFLGSIHKQKLKIDNFDNLILIFKINNILDINNKNIVETVKLEMNFNDTFKSIAVLGGVVCLLIGYQSTLSYLKTKKELETKNKELENTYKMAQENNETQLKITQLNNETQLKIAELQNTKSV